MSFIHYLISGSVFAKLCCQVKQINSQTRRQQQMKKVLAILFATIFVVSTTGLCFAQAAPAAKPAEKAVPAPDKAAADKKAADDKAAMDKKAKKDAKKAEDKKKRQAETPEKKQMKEDAAKTGASGK